MIQVVIVALTIVVMMCLGSLFQLTVKAALLLVEAGLWLLAIMLAIVMLQLYWDFI